ncbi:MAG TPA: S8 family serine peptidase [Propionibacteriaceae bacterium]|nr:S8 family serine peptidase [Propionibacteriaceae bacterium]
MGSRGIGAATALGLFLLGTAAATTASAAPSAPQAPPTAKRYIVVTDSTAVTNPVVNALRARGGKVKHTYTKALSGFSATLTAEEVRELRTDRRVRSVTPDAVVRSSGEQSNPTWGLDRIDQRATTANGSYRYDTTGAGVTAFVIDTGIRLGHSQFGGRATSGYDFVDFDTNAADCDGHGTHVSGTIGGATYGAAKGVKHVSLRVLDCEGSGFFSDSIDALDWVIAHKPAGPAVVNMSLGGGAYSLMDQAVARTVAAGIPVVVAAGNDGVDACTQSPARAPSAITVAATDARDTRPWWSNTGRCVDLFAPGVSIRSASNASNTATEVMSGTSMAAPHVTGVVARYLQRYPRATPAQTASALLGAATPSTVKDPLGSPNKLLYVASQSASVPGVATSVVASKSDAARTGTLKWAPPASNGGKAITGYRVSRNGLDSTGAGPKTVLVSASARSYTFSKLRAGSWYTLSVRAMNSVGTGAAVSKNITQAW